MAIAHRQSIGFDDYLALEEAGEVRHELLDGRPLAMIGSTDLHNLIAGGLYTALRSRLRAGQLAGEAGVRPGGYDRTAISGLFDYGAGDL